MLSTKSIQKIIPLFASLGDYNKEKFVADFIAALVVTVMLVPQAMAYALLAGLPPQVGLYASVAPLLCYSLFGSSAFIAVGPVAMISLFVVSGLSQFASPGSPEFIGLCLSLAFLVGVIQMFLGIFRLGFLVNFISQPVLLGFTSAAAIIIGVSQFKHLFGVSIESSQYPFQLFINTFSEIHEFNTITLMIGFISCVLLLFFAYGAKSFLKKIGIKEKPAMTIAKLGPVVAVVIGAFVVFRGELASLKGVSIVGDVPAGLPGLTVPDLSISVLESLLPLALVISLVGYLESVSIAKVLASRRRKKVNANQELVALGLADVTAAFSGGYPVAGGFSRSMVNFAAGAQTQVASIITATLVALSVTYLTPLFFFIPKAVLAAIVIISVLQLIDLKEPFRLWSYSRIDAVALLVTFASVLAVGIEKGILIGIITTIFSMVWKTSRPRVVEVGRIGDSESFRSLLTHDVKLTKGIFAFRIDRSLNFASMPFVESYVMEEVRKRPDIKHVLLIANGINDIDSTAIDVLEALVSDLKVLGIGFYMSDVKGPVIKKLRLAGFKPPFVDKNIFLSAHEAIRHLSNDPPNLEEKTSKQSKQLSKN